MKRRMNAKILLSTMLALTLPVLLIAFVALASSVDVSVVDVTAPTGSVTLEPSDTAAITVNMTVTGNQVGTATFDVYRNWTLSGGVFTGSNPQTFTVPPRAAGDAATTFTTSGTVAVAAGQAAGTFTLAVSAFNITNTNQTGAKLSDGADSNYQVTVQVPAPPSDTTAPVLTLPANITAEATGPGGAVVTFAATAVDDVDGPVSVTCSPASGSTFPLGATTVNCSATDSAGNEATGSFTVTVVDTTPPTISGVPATLSVVVGAPLSVSPWPTASDLVDGEVTVTNDAPATFPPGKTTVTWTAKDTRNNTATATTLVTATYTFIGFLAPIDNPPVTNVGKAGRTFPLKWQLKDYDGNFVSDLSVVSSLQYRKTASDWTFLEDPVEGDTSGSSGLRYDTLNNQYIFNWQTSKAFSGCYEFVLTLSDGSEHIAKFSFTK